MFNLSQPRSLGNPQSQPIPTPRPFSTFLSSLLDLADCAVETNADPHAQARRSAVLRLIFGGAQLGGGQ